VSRLFAVALVLSFPAASAWAQTAPPAEVAPAAKPAVEPAVKKAAAKPKKAAAKPLQPAVAGPCELGVIAALEDKFSVQKIGITVFGNEETNVPVDWGLNEIVTERVRAAAGGAGVRKIAYPKGAFEPYYERSEALFRIPGDKLTPIVRQVAGNADCERYLVVTTLSVQLNGTNQPLNGIGILDGRGPFGHPTLFTYFKVTIFDGKTFEIRRSPLSNLGRALARGFTPEKPNPLSELDDGAFPQTAAAAAQNTMLRDRIRVLLAEKLDKTLLDVLKTE
jgi:hypothetical protein